MSETPYVSLTPEVMLDALDAAGFRTDGAFAPLNSFENRVYQFSVEDAPPVIAKFYRPGRWTDAAILEEHAFVRELEAADVPCVAPVERDGETLFTHAGFRYAVFPREAGRAPNVEDKTVLGVLGRTIGRLHAVGADQPFAHRQRLTTNAFGHESRNFLLASEFIPDELRDAYAAVTEQLLGRIAPTLESALPATTGQPNAIRLHGDCHLGNLLWRYDAPNLLDFDDTITGPPMQDLWMLLAGDREDQTRQISALVDAYRVFHHFDIAQIRLVEPLRTLRIMRHAAWIAKRWNDPAFPAAFPAFADTRYWSEHVLALKEQLAALDEPPLAIA